MNENDQYVLLVKHTYLDGWFLPGGRVDKSETLQDAIKRELIEELSLTDISVDGLHWVYNSVKEYKNDHIILFKCSTKQQPKISCREIADVDFFPLDNLPEDLTPATRCRLQEYLNDTLEKPAQW